MTLADERTRIAHLFRRAGFGASPRELEEYGRLGFDGAVDQLLNYDQQPDPPAPVTPEEAGLPRWWLTRMLTTARPLQEKMTLFWHGLLTSSIRQVKDPGAMLAQNQLLRTQALGSYPVLLRAISRDAAMISYLDLRSNRKLAPNENYARELMELFTIGNGSFDEDDVREAARAFTGWTTALDGSFLFNRNQHDFGQKAVLGTSGHLDGDAVSDLLGRHPATASRLSARLFAFLAYPNPEPEVVERLAATYQATDGSVRAVVEQILRSPEFLSERAYRALVKSPVELVVGTLRALSLETVPLQAVNALRLLGQELFNPPNVAGWPGRRSWINASSLIGRFNLLALVVNQAGGPVLGGQPVAALLANAGGPEARVQRVLDLLLDGQAEPDERTALLQIARQRPGDDGARVLFRLALALPAYQLN